MLKITETVCQKMLTHATQLLTYICICIYQCMHAACIYICNACMCAYMCAHCKKDLPVYSYSIEIAQKSCRVFTDSDCYWIKQWNNIK